MADHETGGGVKGAPEQRPGFRRGRNRNKTPWDRVISPGGHPPEAPASPGGCQITVCAGGGPT